MDRLLGDLRVALRGYRRTPAFAVAVLVILALGIGMVVAMFTTVRTVLIRRLPVRDQDGIVVLAPYRVPGTEVAAPYTDLPTLRRESRTMRDIAGVYHGGATTLPIRYGDETIALAFASVTANYFDVLGAQPLLGRFFAPTDEHKDTGSAIVLSYGAWRRRFGGDPSIVGRQVIDPYRGAASTIVGVAPAGLDYPMGIEAWESIAGGDAPRVFAIGRLLPGATIEAARAEYLAIERRVRPEYELTGATAQTFTQAVLGDARPTLVALGAAVALLLLIACVNVGTLFLMRAASRGRELTVRAALGARSIDLVRQLVVESAVLAVVGGMLGVATAAALLRALVAVAPAQLPRVDDLRLHGSLVGMALGVTSVAVMLFGVLPALAAARAAGVSPLRQDARSGTETRQRRRVREWLVGAQVALAVVLLTGAAVLARSLQRLTSVDLGYQAGHLTMLSIAIDYTRDSSAEQRSALQRRIETRLRALPGVTGVTTMTTRPLLGTTVNLLGLQAEGQTDADVAANPFVPWEQAAPRYFATLGTRIIRGRDVLESDHSTAPKVVIVNESLARRFWPATDAIGKRLRLVAPGMTVPPGFLDWRTVVGVVADTRYRALRETSPVLYLPEAQFSGWSGNLAVRSTSTATTLPAAIRSAIREVDPTLALWDVRPMDDYLDVPLAQPRLSALLLAGFSLVALTLAAVGLYGALASAVREQTREIGIRMALGATPALVRGIVLRGALMVVAVGCGVGLVGALAGTRVLRSLLFEVSPTDPVALGAGCIVLLAVTALAAYLPVRRATRIDPAQVLRAD